MKAGTGNNDYEVAALFKAISDNSLKDLIELIIKNDSLIYVFNNIGDTPLTFPSIF